MWQTSSGVRAPSGLSVSGWSIGVFFLRTFIRRRMRIAQARRREIGISGAKRLRQHTGIWRLQHGIPKTVCKRKRREWRRDQAMGLSFQHQVDSMLTLPQRAKDHEQVGREAKKT
jgi:hypothetical protein